MNIYLKDFILNEEGSFSITKPFESEQLLNIIIDFVDGDISEMTITDATACMGGDTVRLSNNVKHINAVELSLDNYNLLVENCKNFKVNNISFINEDYTKIYNIIKQDIIYIDPPWGGIGYRNMEDIELKLGEMPISELLSKIKEQKLCKYVFVKVPVNVCLIGINYSIIREIVNKVGMPSFKLICINK